MKPFALIIIACSLLATTCKEPKNSHFSDIPIQKHNTHTNVTKEFKDYWYSGKAEISSYKLEQVRYGETRIGNAVLIFVTEDFLPKIQVKTNNANLINIPVLKLNTSKKFNTGIYPYSIMQSVFYPVSNTNHAIKVSSSIQEWCGQTYLQLNNRSQFEITSHSYFEGEADKNFNLKKTILENELFTRLRISPSSLPCGNLDIIPSLDYLMMHHLPVKAYKASASLTANTYKLEYSELDRTLKINFNPKFPFQILSWEETFKTANKKKTFTNKATLLKTIKSDYWNKNSNKFLKLRDTLKLTKF